jgi:putative ABC transport system permease protein
VLASEAFATENELLPGMTIAAVINGRWRTLRISGVAITPEYVNEARGQAFPDHRRFGILWMRRHHLAAAMGMQGAFNDVSVALAPGASAGDVIAAIDRTLARYGGLGAYGRDEQISHRFLRDELAQDRITSIVIPAIFLAVAALLIHFLLMRVVASQREQIAVLKAFGYGNAAVARHFAGFGRPTTRRSSCTRCAATKRSTRSRACPA